MQPNDGHFVKIHYGFFSLNSKIVWHFELKGGIKILKVKVYLHYILPYFGFDCDKRRLGTCNE